MDRLKHVVGNGTSGRVSWEGEVGKRVMGIGHEFFGKSSLATL